MESKALFLTLLFVSLAIGINGLGLDLEADEEPRDYDDDRAIIVATGLTFGNVFGLNLTTLLPLLALAASAFLPLLCLCALAFAILWHQLTEKQGYGQQSSGYGMTTNTYSEYARAFGLDDFDWEKISLIDWMSIGKETYRNFEVTNLECQKRVICEVHQNVQKFGSVASKFVNMFGYLQYAELLSLPEVITSVVQEYQDAADRGRSMSKDCGDIYPECDFSVKKLYDRFSTNSL